MRINKEEWLAMTTQDDTESEANSLVDHPAHYNSGKHEAIDVIEDWNLGFHCGSVIKYIARHKHKGQPRQDIEKAVWYLQRYLETICG